MYSGRIVTILYQSDFSESHVLVVSCVLHVAFFGIQRTMNEKEFVLKNELK